MVLKGVLAQICILLVYDTFFALEDKKSIPSWGRKVIQILDGRAWRARLAFRSSAGLAS